MAEIIIRPYELKDFTAVSDIFWETTTRTEFANADERSAFRRFYLDSYLSQVAWVAESEGRVLGYIVATLDTLKDKAQWSAHLSLFEDLYERYPAHLHINFRPEARGLGLGSQLVAALENDLKQRGVPGLHLITAATARNVSFYLKNGFSHRVERLYNGKPLLLLGKTL